MCDEIRIAHPQIASDAKKFFSLAMRNYIGLIWSHMKMPEKPSAKIPRCWPAMRKIGMLFTIERCGTPDFGLPQRFGLRCECPRCQIASDAGRVIRTTKYVTICQKMRLKDSLGITHSSPILIWWKSLNFRLSLQCSEFQGCYANFVLWLSGPTARPPCRARGHHYTRSHIIFQVSQGIALSPSVRQPPFEARN